LVFDIIPLDANLVKGSHGAVNIDEKYYPLLIQDNTKASPSEFIAPTDVCELILNHIFD
jgi:hypothetical protein